eukprot:1742649-Pleurochrysis_carterae.AAC.1
MPSRTNALSSPHGAISLTFVFLSPSPLSFLSPSPWSVCDLLSCLPARSPLKARVAHALAFSFRHRPSTPVPSLPTAAHPMHQLLLHRRR